MAEKCEKYEEWGNGFVGLLASLMILWLVLGVWFLSWSGTLLSVVFAALFVSVLFSAFYLTCRHCYYYGKKCYLAVGLVVPYFFERVEGPVAPWRAAVWFVHMLIVIAFAPVFLFRGQPLPHAVLYSALVLAPPIAAVALVSRYSCPRCKHTGCISNPDRMKKATAAAP